MTGFTPGPWTYEVHELSTGFSAIVYDARGHALADHLDEPTASLIAAGPKMYAALTAFEQQWNACGGNSHFGGIFQSVRNAVVEALSEADASHWLNTSRDQLAKARGGA